MIYNFSQSDISFFLNILFNLWDTVTHYNKNTTYINYIYWILETWNNNGPIDPTKQSIETIFLSHKIIGLAYSNSSYQIQNNKISIQCYDIKMAYSQNMY